MYMIQMIISIPNAWLNSTLSCWNRPWFDSIQFDWSNSHSISTNNFVLELACCLKQETFLPLSFSLYLWKRSRTLTLCRYAITSFHGMRIVKSKPIQTCSNNLNLVMNAGFFFGQRFLPGNIRSPYPSYRNILSLIVYRGSLLCLGGGRSHWLSFG